MTNKLKIAVTNLSPFVIEKDGKYSGFEIELWEMIAKEIQATFEYSKYNFQELISLVADKKADIAMASITINEKREEIIDFSHATFHSGLRILLSKNRSKVNIASTLKTFFTQGYKKLLKPLFILALIIIIFGNVLWLAEKNTGAFSKTYFPGIFQAIWFSLSMILGSPAMITVYKVQSWAGFVVVQFGQLIKLAALGLIIGQFTAFLTTRKIKLNIEGPKDLSGKIVATVKGTTTEPVLKNIGATIVSVIKIEEAYEKLKNNEVEAVVFDAPILEYYAFNEGAGKVKIVGELFDKQDYGFVLENNNPLREKINRAILTIQENGLYDTLYKKWFGGESIK